jgi:starch phosphorylase
MAPNLPASVNGGTIATESQVEPLPETTTLPPTRSVPAIAHPTPEDAFGVAANIKYHAQYSPHFSPFKFDPEQAFYSTAESVRDALIQRWNDTYAHFHKIDPKQTYYISMEYLQGRALTNAIGNLNLTDAYAGALSKLGHDLEIIVEQITV